MAGLKKYLLIFAQDYVEFRFQELESLFKLFKINVKIPDKSQNRPFWILENIDEKSVLQIASRSVSLRMCVEMWTCGSNLEEFNENTRKYVPCIDQKLQKESFKFKIESYNRRCNGVNERIQKIEMMNYLDNCFGEVNLKNPDNTFVYFEYFGLDPSNPVLEQIVLGRFLAHGQRDLVNFLSLKKRKFIGNTSMEAKLSILMANQGLCAENDLVLDPFCGTGSLLVSAAIFKSYVIGSDIDFLTLHAKTRPTRAWKKTRDADESIKKNMEQYNVENYLLDIFVGDFSKCPLSKKLIFDSIICDRKYNFSTNFPNLVLFI